MIVAHTLALLALCPKECDEWDQSLRTAPLGAAQQPSSSSLLVVHSDVMQELKVTSEQVRVNNDPVYWLLC
jgi:hypothetical protein